MNESLGETEAKDREPRSSEPAGRTGDEGDGRRRAPEKPQGGGEKSEPDRGADQKDDDDKDGGGAGVLRRHKLAFAIGLIVLLAAIVAGVLWYLDARHYEVTDDAFIDGRPVAISPEVTGNIVSVPVTDNQSVKAGDMLAEIDPRDYEAAVAQAQAQIKQGQANVENYNAQLLVQNDQIDQANNQVQEAQANLVFSRQQDARAQDLVRTGAGTVQNAQQTASDLKAKVAADNAARAALAAGQRQIGVLRSQILEAQAQIAQAQAQLAKAQADLTRTQLHATVDGRVTHLTGAVGAAAAPGQALMVLVPNALWVTANYKETQLADMRPGQPVAIEIDAYGRTWPGKVDSIQSGSGTAFSLLPAENATGNYVKVVQRIPVKITFDKLPDVQIGPGMSVVPSARVR